MPKLILVRHGETAKNVEGILHSLSDTEILNETGIEQMRKTAERLKAYFPVKIYTSNEPRAIQSSELIARQLGIPVEPIENLHERNWGEFSGKPWKEVNAILDPLSLEERYEYLPPSGESWKQFESRLIRAVTSLLTENPEQNAVVVTHGGTIRALMPYLLGAPKEESLKYNPDNASLTVFKYTAGEVKPEAINDTNHLT